MYREVEAEQVAADDDGFVCGRAGPCHIGLDTSCVAMPSASVQGQAWKVGMASVSQHTEALYASCGAVCVQGAAETAGPNAHIPITWHSGASALLLCA